MFLKSLEIAGFKSFRDKIKLDFPAGITAVVGPNGSGKSNIADAVRWVMGEKSVKSLRGSKMEDVIFSGTQFRLPLGFAEVQMLINNAEGLLPIEFSEVCVARRVYRSGESEYMINGSACRMKDVHRLFMDTGVGREGYSIIGQGRVDEILSTRSEDRRQLFEEAAGIVKYKSRRREAFLKLEAEKQNLLRIDDLIEEIKTQIEPLSLQAEQAKVYLKLRDEYKTIHINLFLQEAEFAEAQGKQSRELLFNLSKQSESEENKLAEIREALSAFKLKESEAELYYKEANRRIIKLATDIEKAEGNKRLLERIGKEIAQKQMEKENAARESMALQKELSAAQNVLMKKEAAHAALETKLEALYTANAKYKMLMEMDKEREGYHGSVKAVMRKKDQDRVFGSGIFGAVGELITVPEAYEYAISVALGGSTQNILTATEADAQRAITYLKLSKAGRATFLPATAMKPRSLTQEMDKLLREEGVVGLASHLISYDHDFASVFSHLLGNVFVVEDIGKAVGLSKKYRQSYRLVTLEGDLLTPGGAITGGSSGLKKQSASILGRNRQLNELEDKIAEMREQLYAMAKTFSLTEGNRDCVGGVLTDRQGNVFSPLPMQSGKEADSRRLREKSNAKLTDCKVNISRLSQSIHNAKDKAAKLEEELSAVNSEKAALEDISFHGQADSLHLQLEQQKEKLDATENEVAELREATTRLEAEQKEHMETIARLSHEGARLEVRHEHHEAESRRLHDEVWEAYSLTYQGAQALRNPEYSMSFLRREEKRIKSEMSSLGHVNVGAIEAYQALRRRYDFLTEQRDDIQRAEDQLREVISQLTGQMEQQFKQQFSQIAKHFSDVFCEMFGGGAASLAMNDPDNVLESGIEITAQPPGKNLQSLSLLSGGERALTAIALLFGILRIKPSPFCILDEIESALDDANVMRFAQFLKGYAGDTQFIVITHRKGTMECADTLYGVTMQELGISKMVSVDFR